MNKPRFDPDSGFSLLEVLVAILIVTFFTTVAMQMLVISTAFKARAKEYATAAKLIEQDLENIRSLANQYEFPTISATPSPTPSPSVSPTVFPSVLALSSGNGLKHNDKIQFLGSPNVYTITAPSPIPTANPTITITPGIISPAPTPGTMVASNTVCNNATSTSTGLANYLRTVTQGSSYIDSSKTVAISEGGTTVTYNAVVGANPYTLPDTNKKMWLMRNDTIATPTPTPTNYPYNILQVRYLVLAPKLSQESSSTPSSDMDIVGKLSSEVIPNASFQCIK